jgi:hypothetical protein
VLSDTWYFCRIFYSDPLFIFGWVIFYWVLRGFYIFYSQVPYLVICTYFFLVFGLSLSL